MNIGGRIRELREERGLAQEALSKRAGLGANAINRYESGSRVPNALAVAKIAEALGVEPGELYPKESALSEKSAPPQVRSLEGLRDHLYARLGHAWIALPEEEWSAWWQGVDREEAVRRYRQIYVEADLVNDVWRSSAEGRRILARAGNLNSLVFRRAFVAPYFAPNEDETDETFSARQREGRAIDSYYQSPSMRQRQIVEREVEDEERLLIGKERS